MLCAVDLGVITDPVFMDCLLISGVSYSVSGHGMIVEGSPDLEHWGRRLMASVPDDNNTEPKNCSAPGTLP